MNLLKSFVSPPISAAVVMEGCCYVFGEDGSVKAKPGQDQTGAFWEYSKKFLLKDNLIKRVKDFKEENIKAIHPSKIAKLKVFVQKP
jgi:dynein heavy chain